MLWVARWVSVSSYFVLHLELLVELEGYCKLLHCIHALFMLSSDLASLALLYFSVRTRMRVGGRVGNSRHPHLSAGICYPLGAEWVAPTSHELDNNRLSVVFCICYCKLLHCIHALFMLSSDLASLALLYFSVCTRMLVGGRAGYHGFSAGRGVGPAGNAPEGR
ncbi:hypothetical protein F511_21164 [Dorcoceras hygrometricum]|uniref:Uncharacterized protein n=1 Tax=Dorcoceras hygrometricum TaxID=472368 RepID=A0A2Z7DGY5_9LAMI|nr:hypothetical protein F511_21164 [Dorcoceras hygrometricum]